MFYKKRIEKLERKIEALEEHLINEEPKQPVMVVPCVKNAFVFRDYERVPIRDVLWSLLNYLGLNPEVTPSPEISFKKTEKKGD